MAFGPCRPGKTTPTAGEERYPFLRTRLPRFTAAVLPPLALPGSGSDEEEQREAELYRTLADPVTGRMAPAPGPKPVLTPQEEEEKCVGQQCEGSAVAAGLVCFIADCTAGPRSWWT